MGTDYDKAAGAASGKIEFRVADRDWTFPAELDIDSAIDWLRSIEDTSIATGDRAQTNMALIFGEDRLAELKDAGVGWKTLNLIYVDLLDAYDLQRKPTSGDLGPQVDRLRSAIDQGRNRKVIRKIIDELLAELEQTDEGKASGGD